MTDVDPARSRGSCQRRAAQTAAGCGKAGRIPGGKRLRFAFADQLRGGHLSLRPALLAPSTHQVVGVGVVKVTCGERPHLFDKEVVDVRRIAQESAIGERLTEQRNGLAPRAFDSLLHEVVVIFHPANTRARSGQTFVELQQRGRIVLEQAPCPTPRAPPGGARTAIEEVELVQVLGDEVADEIECSRRIHVPRGLGAAGVGAESAPRSSAEVTQQGAEARAELPQVRGVTAPRSGT